MNWYIPVVQATRVKVINCYWWSSTFICLFKLFLTCAWIWEKNGGAPTTHSRKTTVLQITIPPFAVHSKQLKGHEELEPIPADKRQATHSIGRQGIAGHIQRWAAIETITEQWLNRCCLHQNQMRVPLPQSVTHTQLQQFSMKNINVRFFS